MEPGFIVEYIDRQKILCAVVLEIKNQRLRLLNENNREVKLSVNRISHVSDNRLPVSQGRDRLSESLKDAALHRRHLADSIDIQEIWEVLNSEQEWIDLKTMTTFCFTEVADGDHQAAVVRAFFHNRLYFKFDHDQFFPHSPEQVAQFIAQAEAEEKKNRIIIQGGLWLKRVLDAPANAAPPPFPEDDAAEIIDILKSYYLFEAESPKQDVAKAIMKEAGIGTLDAVFALMVRLKVWHLDENLDIQRMDVPVAFSIQAHQRAARLIHSEPVGFGNGRKDLTHVKTLTIDGQATLDFDDALTLERDGTDFIVGVHIADVGHYVSGGDVIDAEAVSRGSSIYMPDGRIPMLPPELAEGQCSLKAGQIRPAISTVIRMSQFGEIVGSDIHPSLIRVTDQLTYYDVNLMAEQNPGIAGLCQVARMFREQRFRNGAVHIALPEVNVWIDEAGELVVNRTNRESPSRMLVTEIMIMANWIMARFLAENRLPAIFRSQPPPKERLYRDDEGSLFQNWMQRKHLSRFVLGTAPEYHSGLGLDAYLTATSPIRKYTDLITQRQIRSVFGLGAPYSEEDIRQFIQQLETPLRAVMNVQNRRKRYWLLKHLQKRIGQREEAIVLSKRRGMYQALLTDYMMECQLPGSGGINLKPEDTIRVTVQHVDARKDMLSLFIT